MTDNVRRARVSRNTEDHPLGCAIFLTSRQLQELGLNPNAIVGVKYVVEDGDLQLQAQRAQKNQRIVTGSKEAAADD